MNLEAYRYVFSPVVPVDEIEASLLLAVLATESLHGAAQVRLEASHDFDVIRRECLISTGTPVGRDLNRLFVGFVQREFGDGEFRIERVDAGLHLSPSETCS